MQYPTHLLTDCLTWPTLQSRESVTFLSTSATSSPGTSSSGSFQFSTTATFRCARGQLYSTNLTATQNGSCFGSLGWEPQTRDKCVFGMKIERSRCRERKGWIREGEREEEGERGRETEKEREKERERERERARERERDQMTSWCAG